MLRTCSVRIAEDCTRNSIRFCCIIPIYHTKDKVEEKLYADVAVDVFMLALLNGIFGGSILGVISATAGSTLISLYLIWYPITLFTKDEEQRIKDKFTGKSATKSSNVAYWLDELIS